MIQDKTRLEKQSKHLSSRIDDEAIVFHSEKGQYFGLNKVARLVWEHLDNPQSFTQLCQHIEASFHVNNAHYKDELKTFLEELQKKGLISIQNDPS